MRRNITPVLRGLNANTSLFRPLERDPLPEQLSSVLDMAGLRGLVKFKKIQKSEKNSD